MLRSNLHSCIRAALQGLLLLGLAGSAGAATVTLDFDVDPNGDPIADGAVLDNVYQDLGVVLTRAGGFDGVCPGTSVYANASESFASSPNNVTICAPPAGSDFNAGSGLVEGILERPALEVCVAVAPAGSGDFGVLQIVDDMGTVLDSVTSTPNVTQTFCIRGDAIDRFRFAGSGSHFAIFDNLRITYGPNRIDFDTTSDGADVPDGTVVDTLFESEGVTFEKTGASSPCGGPAVYANDDLPTGFGSPPNAVSVCDGGHFADFSENTNGLVLARFPRRVTEACVSVLPSSGTAQGVMRAYDVSDTLLDQNLSPMGVEARLCVTAATIRSVQFAGYQGTQARFDDFEFTFGNASIDFDVDTNDQPLANGTVVNQTYQSYGVSFERDGPTASCGTGDEVYANADSVGDFASSPNQVSACNTQFSDFSENGQGTVHATFALDALSVCVDVRATGAGDYAVLRSYDGSDVQLGEVSSASGATETLCIAGNDIRGVRFAGAGSHFARFDNLDVKFAPEPAATALGASALGVLAGLSRRRRGARQAS